MCHKFLVLTVQKWLKSVYIYGSYREIETGVSLFWTTLYMYGAHRAVIFATVQLSCYVLLLSLYRYNLINICCCCYIWPVIVQIKVAHGVPYTLPITVSMCIVSPVTPNTPNSKKTNSIAKLLPQSMPFCTCMSF